MQRHEKNNRLRRHIGWRWRRGPLPSRPRANQHLVRDTPMRRRNRRKQRRRQRTSDPRQDNRAIPMPLEKHVFFPAAAVDIGIALLETENRQALGEVREPEFEQFLLGGIGVAGEFAGDVDGGAARDEVEDGGGDEFVGEDDGGDLDGAVGSHG